MERLRRFSRDSSLLKNTSKKFADRPMDRIRFASPQAEKRYKEIVRLLQQNGVKSCRSKYLREIPLSMQSDDDTDCVNSSDKRTFSLENCEQLSRKKRRVGEFVRGKLFEDPFFASLGPFPPENSDIFAKMSFVLCKASDSSQCVSRNHDDKKDEEGWKDQPFYSEDRLTLQLNAGGGKVYESFKLVPPDEYERTKLITNAPSLHPERIHCLKAGIPAYSHRWVIRCCQQNKPLDPSQDEIPALDKIHENRCVECYADASDERAYAQHRHLETQTETKLNETEE